MHALNNAADTRRALAWLMYIQACSRRHRRRRRRRRRRPCLACIAFINEFAAPRKCNATRVRIACCRRAALASRDTRAAR